ncbi:hypothetical protein P3L10_004439 [Capsicum annuum]
MLLPTLRSSSSHSKIGKKEKRGTVTNRMGVRLSKNVVDVAMLNPPKCTHFRGYLTYPTTFSKNLSNIGIFAKRVEKRRGKRKEMSPKDAALAIQMSFRAYIIRRSQALRALRELAIFKTKLKELRALFNNFTY